MNPSIYGQPVTLIASVAPANASGIVVFFDGVQMLGTASAPNGQAVLTTLLLHSGNRSLHAVYTGSASYDASASAPLPQTVNPVAANDFKAAALNTSPSFAGPPLAVIDLNGDLKADIVTAFGAALGNGDGTFQPFLSLPAVDGAATIGDFNGDGKPDLATYGGILLGNGDGTFQPAIAFASRSLIVLAADFNGDGKADLATNTGVLLGNRDGTFQPLVAYPSGSGAVVAAGDFNGDGKADLATGTGVLLGNGDGTFQTEIGYPSGSLNLSNVPGGTASYQPAGQGYPVAIGDFNGDGKADVFVEYFWMQTVSGRNAFSGTTGVVLQGNGDGTFQPPPLNPAAGEDSSPIIGVAMAPSSPVAGDFNGDGKLDVAIPSSLYGAVEVFLGNGDGTLQAGVSWSVKSAASSATVITGDLNGDGRADLVFEASDQPDSLGLLFGSSQASPPIVTTAALPTAIIGVAYATALQASGGTPPYRWAVGGSLPGGLTLNAATGIISGTPDGSGGSGVFQIAVQDSADNLSADRQLVLGAVSPIVVSPQTLPAGCVGAPWPSQTLAALGGVSLFGPYTWTIASGSLPPGLSLNSSSGVISGTPSTDSGSPFNFSVTAAESSGMISAPQSFSISIGICTQPVITAIAPPWALIGTRGLTVTIYGTNFLSDSTVRFSFAGSTNLATTYVSPTILTAQIPGGMLSSIGTAQITVVDSNGVISNSFPFIIAPASPLWFSPVAPCRVLDTRDANGRLGGSFLPANTSRTIPVPSSTCGIPANAAAYSLNITVIPRTGELDFLTVWPTGQTRPYASTLNSPSGLVLANAALVPAGDNGTIDAYATNDTDLVVDINGYFVPPASNTLQFYPLPPCRVVDTRNPNGAFGGPSLAGNSSRSFPVPASACNVPADAGAYSFNVTAIPHGTLNYLTAWPTGQTQPFVSTLNSFNGTVLANAAIVPAGAGGAVSFYATDTTDIAVDINGYFAPLGRGGLNFYTTPPCRLVDTRGAIGPLGGPAMDSGTARSLPLPEGSCVLPTVPAYALNITVVPHGPLGYLSIWPTGMPQPSVSTLNAWNGQIAANAALAPADASGSVDVFVSNATDVVVDINGFFGP